MSCFFPVQAWRARRVNPETGKRPLVFNRSAGYADMPIQVPCGKCDGCYADRALSWAIRCYQEASLFPRNSFLTLTYDDAHLPEDGKLVKDDLVNFFKRLRHDCNFRYYACGEYGGQTGRAHYHALIFGQDFIDSHTFRISESLYCNPRIQKIWGKGIVSISEFTMGTACYVAGYVGKKIGKDDGFQIMSRGRRPDGGIGYRWLMRYLDDVSRLEQVVIEGKEYPVPARYLAWAEEELAHVKLARSAMYRGLDPAERDELNRLRDAKAVYQRQRIEVQLQKGKI